MLQIVVQYLFCVAIRLGSHVMQIRTNNDGVEIIFVKVRNGDTEMRVITPCESHSADEEVIRMDCKGEI